MNEKGRCPDETEMKNILADWFYHGDMPEDRVHALAVLIKAFKKTGNNPLAGDLKKIKDNAEVQRFLLQFYRDFYFNF